MAEKAQRGNDTWTAEEKAAMQEHAAEQKAARARGGSKADKAAADAQNVLDKIAELPDDDRALAERIHELVTATGPDLAPKTYYGMPAYYKDGKVLVFFQAASKFKVRYGTLGFETSSALDDGDMWPTSFAVLKIGPAEEKRIVELVKRAIG